MSLFIRPYVLVWVLLILTACQTGTPEPEAEVIGPPSTDIWLFSISPDGIELQVRVTDLEGYDNQPMFSPNGGSLLFSSDRTGKTHTYRYDIESRALTQLTFGDAETFSPTPIPGTNGEQFSVVYADSLVYQGLWRYTLGGSLEPSPIVTVDAVAYYTWIGAEEVLFFRLGTPNSLQLINVATADTRVLAEGSVLSLHPIPGEAASAYIFQDSHDTPQIMRYDWLNRESTMLAPSIEGGKYFCVAPDGRLLMLDGGKLMAFTPGASVDWIELADLGLSGGTRLAVSPDGTLLAVVGERIANE